MGSAGGLVDLKRIQPRFVIWNISYFKNKQVADQSNRKVRQVSAALKSHNGYKEREGVRFFNASSFCFLDVYLDFLFISSDSLC